MAWYPGQTAQAAGPQQGDALKISQGKPDWKAKLVTPKSIFTSAGCFLLTLLAIVPLWNATTLLQNSNYVFWADRSIPYWIIVVCVGIVLLYAASIQLFFRNPHDQKQIEQTIMIVASIFITLFGFFLMVASIPLTQQAELTYTNLVHRCGSSEQTHRLYEYSQVLQNIRATPACAVKYSVEECAGYQESAPYTNFLRGMENNFRCAGFCYTAPAVGFKQATLLSSKQSVRQQSLATDAAQTEKRSLPSPNMYPPTLFSDLNFKSSCDGMAARDMKNFAGDIGNQTFFQGIYLIFVAIVCGFLKILSFCMRKA